MPGVAGGGTHHLSVCYDHSIPYLDEDGRTDQGSVFSFNSPTATGPSTHHQGIVTDAELRTTVSAGSRKVGDFSHWKTDEEGKARYAQCLKIRTIYLNTLKFISMIMCVPTSSRLKDSQDGDGCAIDDDRICA